jgi:P27 family predicted phage terminase small subunit
MLKASAPAHLSKRSRALWVEITARFTLEPTELELLRLALEAVDRCEEARQVLAAEGITSVGRYGQRLAHPACAIERDARLAAARLFKQLALPEALDESVSPLTLRWRRRAG